MAAAVSSFEAVEGGLTSVEVTGSVELRSLSEGNQLKLLHLW